MKITSEASDNLIQKRDYKYIAILAIIALTLGTYLIMTTVVITQDGVFYIEQAQQLESDPARIIKEHPPGYPFLILTAHKCAAVFTDNTSINIWIYSAQAVTLLCRLLALIPLYFIGKLLVGSKHSFWAILILICLPFPTQTACDVIREWPYILVLATGFFFLLWSAKSGKWPLFGIVGLASGLGYIIRPETAQLMIYSLLWAGLSLIKPKLWNVPRWKNATAIALLLICFAALATPYMAYTGKFAPDKLKSIIKSFSSNTTPSKIDTPQASNFNSNRNTAASVPDNILEALGETFETICENLMWFFVPMLLVGIWVHFRQDIKYERVLITAFIVTNIAMMVLRYCYIDPDGSKRWSMPLVALTIFYIPIGLQTIGNRLDKLSLAKQKTDMPKGKRLSWSIILLLIGLAICTPKLLRPIRAYKQGYRDAANWLRENTAPTDIIATVESRIAFYAERERIVISEKTDNTQGDYTVKIVKGDDAGSEASFWVDEKRKKKKVAIYRSQAR